MAENGRDDDDQRLRSAGVQERSVIGGAPIGGRPTMVSSGAFDTPGGGDLGGPGSRDYGDSAGDLRPGTSRDELAGDLADASREGAALAHDVFGSDEDTNPDQLTDALREQAKAQGRDDAARSGDPARHERGGQNNDNL